MAALAIICAFCAWDCRTVDKVAASLLAFDALALSYLAAI
jgi:hypothetical protein